MPPKKIHKHYNIDKIIIKFIFIIISFIYSLFNLGKILNVNYYCEKLQIEIINKIRKNISHKLEKVLNDHNHESRGRRFQKNYKHNNIGIIKSNSIIINSFYILNKLYIKM